MHVGAPPPVQSDLGAAHGAREPPPPWQSQREVKLQEDQEDKAFGFSHEKMEFFPLPLSFFSGSFLQDTHSQIASAGFHGGEQIIGRDVTDTLLSKGSHISSAAKDACQPIRAGERRSVA